jgi:hypothetical protein
MQNAHLRLGRLRYSMATEKRSTFISVLLDRIVVEKDAESPNEGRVQLMSVLGSDTEISAISAAVVKGANFRVEAPGLDSFAVTVDAKPQCFRGSVSIAGRNRPSRHLLAISQEWSNAASSSNPSKVYLLHSSPEFIWTNVAYIYGLPARPEWAQWFHHRLQEEQAIVQLFGIGCDPVIIQGDRDKFLAWLGEGVAAGTLEFPSQNGPILWPTIKLTEILMPVALPDQIATSPHPA